jgi:hypothetical protein
VSSPVSVNISLSEGKVAVFLHLHSELDVLVNAVVVVKNISTLPFTGAKSQELPSSREYLWFDISNVISLNYPCRTSHA